jgi:hypothetical protein
MKEAVERRLVELEGELEKAKAGANALAGAIAVLKDLLASAPKDEDDAPPAE